jgi:transcription termination factor Rho
VTETHDAVAAPAPGAQATPANLSGLKVAELQALAARLGIAGAGRMRKADLLSAVLERSGSASTSNGGRANGGASTGGTRSDAADAPEAAADGATTNGGTRSAATGTRATGTAARTRRRATSGVTTPAAAPEAPEAGTPAVPTQAEPEAADPTRSAPTRSDASRSEAGRSESSRSESDAEESGRGVSRVRRRAQRDAQAAVEEAVLKAEPILPDLPPREPRTDRSRTDRTSSDRTSSDRNGNDRNGNDRTGNDRNGVDRTSSDRTGNDRNGRDDRPQRGQDDRVPVADRSQGEDRGTAGPRDDFDDERGGRRRRGRNRQRDKARTPGGRERGPGGMDSEPEVREDDVLVPVAGIVDILDSYAFVRTSGYLAGPHDVYVSLSQVKKYGLRKGDAVVGQVKQERPNEERRQKYNAMVRVDSVNGQSVEEARNRDEFGKLTPLYPQERLRLETEPTVLTTRIIDLVAPIGKGQRGLIVSPPKAGKTLVLQAIANAITTNNPECHLMVVLVDERPEEVTDMQRTVKGEVIASTFDRPAEDHTTVAELAIERAKRLVELGHDVVVLLDSITRLGRAYNLAAPASGRILSGGVDSSALYPPKRFFGAARNIENGGSLTILATALVETGSKMDEVIFEEFKGTGNMELRLSRQLADKRIFPAVDVNPSGTRREEVLLGTDELRIMWQLRRVLSALDAQQAIELLLDRLKKSRSNTEFLLQVNKTAPGGNRDDA